jgi:hypothetical protein
LCIHPIITVLLAVLLCALQYDEPDGDEYTQEFEDIVCDSGLVYWAEGWDSNLQAGPEKRGNPPNCRSLLGNAAWMDTYSSGSSKRFLIGPVVGTQSTI